MTPHAQVPRSERVLILIDFINPLDFPGSEKLAPPALRAARATLRLRERLDQQGVAVIYSNDNYGVWQSDFHSLVAQCLAREGISSQIARLLAPRATDVTLLKPRHSAFYGSPLELLLKEMGAQELILCGLATDMCVQMTAADAFLRGGFKVRVPADCTAAETPQAKATALKYMASVLRCDVRSSTRAS
jgi:nicotinamidase-related amidase